MWLTNSPMVEASSPGVGERGEVIQLGQGFRAHIGQHVGQDCDVLAEPGAGFGSADRQCRCRDPGRLGGPEGPGGQSAEDILVQALGGIVRCGDRWWAID